MLRLTLTVLIDLILKSPVRDAEQKPKYAKNNVPLGIDVSRARVVGPGNSSTRKNGKRLQREPS